EKKPIDKDSERLRGAEAAFRELLTMPDAYAEQAGLGLAETLYRLDRLLEAEDVLATLLERPKLSDVTKDRARLLLKNPRCVTEPCLPNFSFVTEDGELESSDALRGKVVLLSFWATWCRPCEAAVPDLKRVYKVNARSPFVMIGVNMHDEPVLMQRFLEQNQITWPQLAGDHSARLIETMQISAIPTEILFDHEGVLVSSTTGWGSTSGNKLYQAVGRATKLAKKQAVAAPSSSR
ncbi:MAG TPA: TlpA disulfide reductase family protein, partial [Vicinamibacteria bacterium]